MQKTVVELFAGVGGFRVGLNNVKLKGEKVVENGDWEFVLANQWEPSTKSQPAFECYTKRFGNSPNHINKDISTIINEIPDHTLLVGGFPCQDYSVARSLSGEKGIEGKKGVLWWSIRDILDKKRPSFVLLENVDRLLKSPSKQRGRDFGIILKSLHDLGYSVEWRVINAADYGHAQRRRRVFIFAFHNTTSFYNNVNDLSDWIKKDGFFQDQFPISHNYISKHLSITEKIEDEYDLVDISNNFTLLFRNSGILFNNIIHTQDVEPIYSKGKSLRAIRQRSKVDEQYFLTGSLEKWEYLKGAKRIKRVKPDGNSYYYSEGSMLFPDSLDKPGRTMLTSESTTNRSSHVIQDLKTLKLRKLTPIECERLNEFPDNWTDTGLTDRQRYFTMGNALVCGLISKMEKSLSAIISKEM